jgi:DNA (cytosine-5)-methyltransferase 1
VADTKSEQDRGLQQPQLSPDTGTGSQPTHLDIFSGIAGWGLAAQWSGFRTLGFVEIERYAQRVLAKHFPGVPIHSDIFDFDGTNFRGVDLITGSPPCQPYSVAGKRRGSADDRALWPEMFRVIGEARPTWTVIEEVAGFISMELDNVLSDLEGIGYATRSFVIPACAVDARHRRDRLWIVAKSISKRGRSGNSEWEYAGDAGQRYKDSRNHEGGVATWLPEPAVRGVAHRLPEGLHGYWQYPDEWEGVPRVSKGVKDRVSRLKALGNSIQSQVAYELLREIRKLL